MNLKLMASVITAVAFIVAPAHAKPKKPRAATQTIITCTQQGCSDVQYPQTTRAATRFREAVADTAATIVGGRPAGCPHRYCGCALSLKIFGRKVEGLNLAANWKRKFPHAPPGPGMVAARSGHVFYIQSMIDADTALAWDPNSGRGMTRIHQRSLRGYTVVDPHGNRLASIANTN